MFFSVFCCFVFFVSFPFFVFNRKPCFPSKKGIFVYFWLSPFVSPKHFLASPFCTFSFSVSLFSSFLPSCLSLLLSFGSLFLSLSFFLFLRCLCFMKRTTSKYSLTKLFFYQSFLFLFGFLSSFLLFLLVFSFLFIVLFYLCFKRITLLSPLKKGIFVYFWVSPFVSPWPFWPPLFSISLSLSLSLSRYFLSFFLLVFFCFLLVPCFCLFLSFSVFFGFVSWKKQHQNIQLRSIFSSILSHYLVSCLVFSLRSLCRILGFFFFPDFKLCSLFNINVFGFKKYKFKNTNFWWRGGLQQNVFFNEPVFCKMWKVII